MLLASFPEKQLLRLSYLLSVRPCREVSLLSSCEPRKTTAMKATPAGAMATSTSDGSWIKFACRRVLFNALAEVRDGKSSGHCKLVGTIAALMLALQSFADTLPGAINHVRNTRHHYCGF